MFIELTDLLRCPAEHDESYLVLLPDIVEHRIVLRGELGCPVCGATFPIDQAQVRFAEAVPDDPRPSILEADGIAAFLGLDGPGGYVVLVGSAATATEALGGILEGIHLVAVNPPVGFTGGPGVSVLWADRIPLKTGSARGVVVGPVAGDEGAWLEEAGRVVLSGRHIVGQGPLPDRAGWEVLGHAADAWVVRRA